AWGWRWRWGVWGVAMGGVRRGEAGAPRLKHAEHGGIGREPGFDRQLEVIVRIIGRRIDGEAARRTVLESLVDRQDHQPAAAAELAVHQDAGEIVLGAGIVALVPRQNLPDLRRHLHGAPLSASYAGSAARSGTLG